MDPSTWTSSTTGYIGDTTSGILTINGSSNLSSQFGEIGYGKDSTGIVIVDGGGAKWTNTDTLDIGYLGNGTLNIINGGNVDNKTGCIGYSVGSTGTVKVDGLGSIWTMNNGSLSVGRMGNGTLLITNGGCVTGSGINSPGCSNEYLAMIGSSSGSIGTVTVDGTGSALTVNGTVYVGNAGSGALNILNGGAVTVANGTYVGNNLGSPSSINFGTSGGTLTTGTLYAAPSQLTGVGTIYTRGMVSDMDLIFDATHALTQTIALNSFSDQNVSIHLDLSGSPNTNGSLGVGFCGANTLTIQDGISVNTGFGYLGYSFGSSGTAKISGEGSIWTISGILYAGYSGNGTLLVANGGSVNSSFTYLGCNSSSTGIATVDGSGSTWSISSSLYLGNAGNGMLNITNGGSVSNYSCVLAYDSGSTGIASVDGPGSKWTNNSTLELGYVGSGNLKITSGGTVSNSTTGRLGYATGATGTVTVDGIGSTWTNSGYLYVGYSGNGSLLISHGGGVNNANCSLGNNSSSTGIVTVCNSGSTWTNSGYLYVGNSGSGTLKIVDGGNVSNAASYLAYSNGSTGIVTVDGVGSTWTNINDLYVGNTGSGTLNITNGGNVKNANGRIGHNYLSTGMVTVVGAGSKWVNSGSLCIGGSGGGTLNIACGGTVSNTTGFIGSNIGTTSVVTVDGTGSTWINSESLYLADWANGDLKITNGGAVSNRTCYMGFGRNATGEATVDGAGSTWNHSDGVNVGYENSCMGIVNVIHGGALNSFSGTLGYNTGSAGVISITGPGSMWTNTGGGIMVGSSGRGTLNVTAGGTLANGNSGTYIGGYPGSIGVATIDGTTSKWTEGDLIEVGLYGNGTLNITNGGIISSKRLFLSYIGQGQLNIYSGGILNTGTSYIGQQANSLGLATIDGDGSAWNNSGALYVGYNSKGCGILNIRGGGVVTASPVSINSQSLLTIDVGCRSLLSTSGGAITNNGNLRILAGAGAKAENIYSPISAGTWGGTGAYQAVGGTWNSTTHQFTVSTVQSGTSGVLNTLNLASKQRLLIADAGTSWAVGESFLAKTGTLNFTATVMNATELAGLGTLLTPGRGVVGAWDFAISGSGYSTADPVYLSFDVGADIMQSDLDVWHYDGSKWTAFTANDLTYDGRYASFTVTSFSGYAITVPEPSALAMLLTVVVGGLLWWKRRRE